MAVLSCAVAVACRTPPPAPAVETPRQPFVESPSSQSAEELGALKDLLRRGEYDELERRLGAAQAAYEADPTREREPELAFQNFSSSDPADDAPLRAWIQSRPDSAFAHLARGLYLEHRGWLRRGHAVVARTPDAQFEAMGEQFASARPELHRAVALNPGLTIADAGLLRIAMAEGDGAEVRARFAHALEVNPLSYYIRQAYLVAQLPQWGGTAEEMDRIVGDAQKHVARNPRLAVLKGFRSGWVDAPTAFRAKDVAGALRHYDDALAHGEDGSYLRERAMALQKLGRHKEAIADCTRVLQIWPQAIKTLRVRAGSLYAIGETNKAAEDVALGLSIDPADEELLALRAWARERDGLPEGSLADVEAGLRARPESAHLWARKGRLLLDHGGDLEQARTACQRAIELDIKLADAWLCRGLVQAREGNDGSRTTFTHYLKLKDDADTYTRLADRYRLGTVVAKDPAEAARLYGEAARRGHPAAQANLGHQLMTGSGVAKDYVQARRWLESAAKGGDAYAMGDLGVLYHEGWGVPRDRAVAADWFRKSIAGGYVHGRYYLGVMYREGRGVHVQKDLVTAYRLLKGAADQGDADSLKELPALQREMSLEQMQAGEAQLAEERAARP